jgi:hypothetical protein
MSAVEFGGLRVAVFLRAAASRSVGIDDRR